MPLRPKSTHQKLSRSFTVFQYSSTDSNFVLIDLTTKEQYKGVRSECDNFSTRGTQFLPFHSCAGRSKYFNFTAYSADPQSIMSSQQTETMGENDKIETQDDKQGWSSGLGQPEQFDIFSFWIQGLGNCHHLIHIIKSPSNIGCKRAALLFSGTMASGQINFQAGQGKRRKLSKQHKIHTAPWQLKKTCQQLALKSSAQPDFM